MSTALMVFSIVAVTCGAFFFMAGTIGLLRFPDTLSRLHALTKVDNLGLGLIALGVLPQASWPFGALKIICVWVLAQLAGATVAQLLARLARQNAHDA
ncbi:monovalent cation/H(+) antiporter subunit G [Aureimonas fodinaquatilis]|uniref:Monovalent cation/H(+) antiporter subunit G n=1 Tax=Aureimonas fodinaquatilis TaxID=2565783 RepID=A0A5B0DZF7_9HYPH|nr:monovalent cation/H(+) antiporter subunit G [Aureimonas fodinaquatilis]KAA0971923.1 monovalent cation/H(+) antiporter subunit G [Aureimonas fodinaquatilis]